MLLTNVWSLDARLEAIKAEEIEESLEDAEKRRDVYLADSLKD